MNVPFAERCIGRMAGRLKKGDRPGAAFALELDAARLGDDPRAPRVLAAADMIRRGDRLGAIAGLEDVLAAGRGNAQDSAGTARAQLDEQTRQRRAHFDGIRADAAALRPPSPSFDASTPADSTRAEVRRTLAVWRKTNPNRAASTSTANPVRDLSHVQDREVRRTLELYYANRPSYTDGPGQEQETRRGE